MYEHDGLPFEKVVRNIIWARINSAPVKKSQSFRLDDLISTKERELANGVDNEHPALVAFMKHQNIETLNREILIELVDYIKVYENGNINVRFKFADELRKIAERIEINTAKDHAVAG